MKLILPFLALLAGVAFGQIADQEFLNRQHAIYRMLQKPHQLLEDPELKEIAYNYNPYNNYYNYDVPQTLVHNYVQQVGEGQILPRGDIFNVHDDAHRQEMQTLFQMLHQAKDWETFHQTAAWARQRVNEYMFVYAYTTALLHRADTQNFKIPPTYEILPQAYMTPEVLRQALMATRLAQQNNVVIPMTFAYKYYNNPEQRMLAYHSEDLGLGQLYDLFHKQFPFWNCQNQERQGELFHHFLQQTLARYNQARLSSYLPLTQRLSYRYQHPIYRTFYGNQYPTTYEYQYPTVYGYQYPTGVYGYPKVGAKVEGVEGIKKTYAVEKEQLRGIQQPIGQEYQTGYGYQYPTGIYGYPQEGAKVQGVEGIKKTYAVEKEQMRGYKQPIGQEYHTGIYGQEYPEGSLEQAQEWERRIQEAIDAGHVRDIYGQQIRLDQINGMDILGKMIQGCQESANPAYYGNLRQLLHQLTDKQQEGIQGYYNYPGMFGDYQTYAKSPAYYRVAELINQLFQRHQSTMTPYTREQLEFPGVEVETVEVVSERKTAIPNQLTTYFENANVDLTNGIDATLPEDLAVEGSIQRLHHEGFQYIIKVNSVVAKKALVRIYLAPVYDSFGVEIPLSQQRQHFVELDKFVVQLSQGETVIRRSSRDSSVTVPEGLGFKQLINEVVAAKNGQQVFIVEENQPRCGIPNRLLLPKGTPEGLKFNLLVMVTDYEKEVLEQYQYQPQMYKQQYQQQGYEHIQQYQQEQKVVVQAEKHYLPTYAQCGLIDGTYPFKQSMGYPFDRPIQYHNKMAFATSNMKFVDVVVKHMPTVY